MAKKPKKQKYAATQQPEEAPVAEAVAETAPAAAPEPKAAPAASSRASSVSLQDYARQNVIGYKDHWWPSIAKFAESHGIKSEAPADKCRSVLTSWGAALK